MALMLKTEATGDRILATTTTASFLASGKENPGVNIYNGLNYYPM